MKKKKLKKRIKELEVNVDTLLQRIDLLTDRPNGRLSEIEKRIDTLSNRISNLSVPNDFKYKLDDICKQIDILKRRTDTDYSSFGNNYIPEACANCVHQGERTFSCCSFCYDPLKKKYTHFKPKEEPKTCDTEPNATKPE